jgi:uncharacterized membrane protein YadS
VSVVAAKVFARQSDSTKSNRFTIPWFILLFLLAALVRAEVPALDTTLWANTSINDVFHWLAVRGLMLTLFMIGASLSLKALKEVGWRPLLQGALLWLLLGVGSLLVVRATVV